MILACCPSCGGEYTTLATNLTHNGSWRNQCGQCGAMLEETPKVSQWRFQARHKNKVWGLVEDFCEAMYLPHLRPDVFRAAFFKYMSWKAVTGQLLLRSNAAFNVPSEPIPLGMRGLTPRLTGKEMRFTRRTCLMSEEYRPRVLWAASKVEDAVRIRYAAMEAEGVPASVLYFTKVHIPHRYHRLSPLCRPAKVIMVSSRSNVVGWLNSGNPCDLWVDDRMGMPIYPLMRILEDELLRPTHSIVDPDTGVLRMGPDQFGGALASVGGRYAGPFRGFVAKNLPYMLWPKRVRGQLPAPV